MREERLCFECAYWINYIANPDPNAIIASHKVIKQIEPFRYVNMTQARKKDMQFVIDLKTKQIYGCSGLIVRAEIPQAFWDKMPDQYKLISKDTYSRFYKFQAANCRAKGCYDRYHCWWYHPELVEGDTPWNKIPDNYVVGSELCPSFINKSQIYDTD